MPSSSLLFLLIGTSHPLEASLDLTLTFSPSFDTALAGSSSLALSVSAAFDTSLAAAIPLSLSFSTQLNAAMVSSMVLMLSMTGSLAGLPVCGFGAPRAFQPIDIQPKTIPSVRNR